MMRGHNEMRETGLCLRRRRCHVGAADRGKFAGDAVRAERIEKLKLLAV